MKERDMISEYLQWREKNNIKYDKKHPPEAFLKIGSSAHKHCVEKGLCPSDASIADMSLFEYIIAYPVLKKTHGRGTDINTFLTFKTVLFVSGLQAPAAESVLGKTVAALVSKFEFKPLFSETDILASLAGIDIDDVPGIKRSMRKPCNDSAATFMYIFERLFEQKLETDLDAVRDKFFAAFKKQADELFRTKKDTGMTSQEILRECASAMGDSIFKSFDNTEGFHGSEFEVLVCNLRGAATRFYDERYKKDAEEKLAELIFDTLIFAAHSDRNGFAKRVIDEPESDYEKILISVISPFVKLAGARNLHDIFSGVIIEKLIKKNFMYAFTQNDKTDAIDIYKGLAEIMPVKHKSAAIVDIIDQRSVISYFLPILKSIIDKQEENLENVNLGTDKLNKNLFNVPDDLVLLIAASPKEELLMPLLSIITLDYTVKAFIDDSVPPKEKASYLGKLSELFDKYPKYEPKTRVSNTLKKNGIDAFNRNALEERIGFLCMDAYEKDNNDEASLTRAIVAFRNAEKTKELENALKLLEEKYPKEFIDAQNLAEDKKIFIASKSIHSQLTSGKFNFYIPMQVDNESFYNAYFLSDIDSETAARKGFGALDYEKPILTTLMSGQNIVFHAPQVVDTNLRKLADIPEYLQLFQSGFLSVSFYGNFTSLADFCIDRLGKKSFKFSSMPFLDYSGNNGPDTAVEKCRNKIAECLKNKRMPTFGEFSQISGQSNNFTEISAFVGQILKLDESIPSFYKCYHFQHNKTDAQTLLREWLNHEYTQKEILLPEQYTIHRVIDHSLTKTNGVYTRSDYVSLLEKANMKRLNGWKFESVEQKAAFEEIISGFKGKNGIAYTLEKTLEPMYDILANNYNIALSSGITPFSKSSYNDERLIPTMLGKSLNRKSFEKKTYEDFSTIGIKGPAVNIRDAMHYVYALRQIIKEASGVSKLISKLNNSPELSSFAQYDYIDNSGITTVSASIETTERQKLTIHRGEAENPKDTCLNLITEEK